MKADEATRRIEFIVDKTVSDWGNVMLEVAQTADTMIKDRVIKTGQNAEGQYYPGYSTKPMLTNLSKDVYDVKNGSNITNKARAEKYGSKKKRKELKWVTLQRGGKNIRLFELEGGYRSFATYMADALTLLTLLSPAGCGPIFRSCPVMMSINSDAHG